MPFDDGFRAQPMPDGVSPRLPFAFLGSGTGASDSVASVGFSLTKRGHRLERSTVLTPSASSAGSSFVAVLRSLVWST
jgi:hypothetical protein